MIGAGIVLLWVLVLLALVGVVAWRTGAWREFMDGQSRPAEPYQPMHFDDDDDDGLPITQPASYRDDLPPAWQNTVPSEPMPLGPATPAQERTR